MGGVGRGVLCSLYLPTHLCFHMFLSSKCFFLYSARANSVILEISHHCSSVKIHRFYLAFANSRIFHHQEPLLATMWINTHEYMIKCRVKKQKAGKMVFLINSQHTIERLCLWKAYCEKAEMAK